MPIVRTHVDNEAKDTGVGKLRHLACGNYFICMRSNDAGSFTQSIRCRWRRVEMVVESTNDVYLYVAMMTVDCRFYKKGYKRSNSLVSNLE